MGRNLITLFSTVNTLREKSFCAPSAIGAIWPARTLREAAVRAREASMPRRWRKTKNTFFQWFHLCGAALTTDKRLTCEAFANGRLRPPLLRESMRYVARRSSRILAPHQPDCANLRELETPFRRSRTRLRHRTNAFRTTFEGASIAPDERAVGIRRARFERSMASVARGVRVETPSRRTVEPSARSCRYVCSAADAGGCL